MAPNATYIPLQPSSSDDEQDLHNLQPTLGRKVSWKDGTLILLAITNIIFILLVFRDDLRRTKTSFPDFSGIYTKPGALIKYEWWSTYGSPNRSDSQTVDDAWNAIHPAHGFIALDHGYAAKKELPKTLEYPSDPTKGVYVIEAYHQFHCLTRIRKAYFQLARGETVMDPGGHYHADHCFDTLRQYIMCTASDTPLYFFGNVTADGQPRQCRDWNVLREWASENTACVKDSDVGLPLMEYFGHCDDGRDGLEITGL